jgi:hypothetical protein
LNPEYIAPFISVVGAVVLAFLSFLLKRLLHRIDGIDRNVTALDAMTSARIHNLDQATQARIAGLEQVADAKIRECHLAHTNREDGLMRMIVENANEADRKYATVWEMLNVQERLLAIDNNVRAVLAAMERLLLHSGK